VTGSSALRIGLGRDSLAGRIQPFEVGPLRLSAIAALRGFGDLPPAQDDNGTADWLRQEFWSDLGEYARRSVVQAKSTPWRRSEAIGGHSAVSEDGPNSGLNPERNLVTINVMKPLRVSQDIVPIGEFKGHASRWLRRASESGQPVVITQNGRPAGVLVSATEFDRLVERQGFLESVAAGITDADAGRTMDSAELRRQLTARRAQRSSS
jgi:prevent-host-death family protein